MVDLSTNYLGLKLKNPIIVGSCDLCSSVQGVLDLEHAGAGAVVLKSLFEEQILREISSMEDSTQESVYGAEGAEYLSYFVKENRVEGYLKLITDAKHALSIPVIPSISCLSAGEWTAFASRVEEAGADALEVNMFIMPSDPDQSSADLEALYLKVARDVKEAVSIPVSLKISSYFSGMANFLIKLSRTDVDGLVLFNRFYSPDIDLKRIKISSGGVYSTPDEFRLPLRWTAILSDRISCDIAATTGVHDGDAALKAILAGATAVQVASTLYHNGPQQLEVMLEGIRAWMNANNYDSLGQFRGKLSQGKVATPQLYERAQFMKYFHERG